ncbi:MAG: GvpL/GvpF family gas vesicle protein [Pseudomonadota bacterium]
MSLVSEEIVGFVRRAAFEGHGAIPKACRLDDTSNEIAAIVAPRPADLPRRATKRTFRRRLTRQALERQLRLEALHRLGDILPAAPGSPPPPDIDALLRGNSETLLRGLNKLSGRAQYQVIVSWDVERAAERFSFDAADLPALALQLNGAISAVLTDTAEDAISLPRDVGHLANVVVLIPRMALPRLDVALERIDALWTEGLKVRLLGPGPGVSFVRAIVQPVKSEGFQSAAEHLGLDAEQALDLSALARARKHRLMRLDEASGQRPEDIDQAARTLGYCARLGLPPAGAEDGAVIALDRDGPSIVPNAEISLEDVA